MQEIRCKKCDKLLGKVRQKQIKYISVNVVSSEITEIEKPTTEPNFECFEVEIKCPRCGELNTK